MKDKLIAIEATYWYTLLEKVEKDQTTLPFMKKLLKKYINKELIRIKKVIEDENNTN